MKWHTPTDAMRRRWREQREAGARAAEDARRRGHPRNPHGLPSIQSPSTPATTLGPSATSIPLAAKVYGRLAFGPRTGDIAAFEALGATDDQRLTAWVDQQLAPHTIDDSSTDARLVAAGYQTLDKTIEQLWADHQNSGNGSVHMQPLEETEAATFLRACWSRRQLFEVLVDFWHTHFSVYGQNWAIGPVWVQYDRNVIRAHALGNFRQMLEACAKSTAMLHYLDNYLNSEDGPNENYARELFELHTLGADAYFGVVDPGTVPLDGQGRPVGFVDRDIQEATRCLTGWTYDFDYWQAPFSDTGGYFYHDAWHDSGPKTVLGVDIPAGQGPEQDGLDVLDLIASHPATARHLALKLCRRLIADSPPERIVDEAATVFTDSWQAPDQIRQVVRAIVLSPEFRDTWGAKVRRPFEIVTAAKRATGMELPYETSAQLYDWFRWVYSQTGHELFGWEPPNGYPDVAGAWLSTTPRVLTWKMTNFIVDYNWDLDEWRVDLTAATPPGVRSANALVDYWIDRVFAREIDDSHRDELVEFMAQGYLPHLDLPLDSDESVQSRLQALVGLMFWIPEFFER